MLALKAMLTKAGEHAPAGVIHGLNATVNYLEAGRWFKSHGYRATARLRDRYRLFDRIIAQVADERVLYLEFGVWRGEATRYWSARLRHPAARLHGFDSFTGLPEHWNERNGEGGFSTGGRAPLVDDPRVEFFTGWFEQTLPAYRLAPHDRLVVNIDADLYSSAKTVLTALRDAIVPGTYLYFDEFTDRMHEMRAFDEYLAATGQRFALVGATTALQHVAFQRVG